jgi:glucose-6-phosphate 1-epimerase
MPAVDLNPRFAIADSLQFEDAPGGLIRAVIATPLAEANIYLQGAHIAHWTPKGQRPVLFTSSRSLFAPGKAIRGGVPIIFPWFGARGHGLPGPAHGFARSMDFEVESTAMRDDGSVEIVMGLVPNKETSLHGYPRFRLAFKVAVGTTLEMELTTYNNDGLPMEYEEALHTYLSIGDINKTTVTGLDGTMFIDKTDGFTRKQESRESIRVDKETDSLYLNTTAACVVHDAAWGRAITVEKTNSSSTVVWNPWIEKTRAMKDMAPEDWREMICVESANAADNAITLGPGESRAMATTIRVG